MFVIIYYSSKKKLILLLNLVSTFCLSKALCSRDLSHAELQRSQLTQKGLMLSTHLCREICEAWTIISMAQKSEEYLKKVKRKISGGKGRPQWQVATGSSETFWLSGSMRLAASKAENSTGRAQLSHWRPLWLVFGPHSFNSAGDFDILNFSLNYHLKLKGFQLKECCLVGEQNRHTAICCISIY